MGHKGPVYKVYVHRNGKGSNPIYINQSINQPILRYHLNRDRRHYKIHCDAVCQLFFLLLINPVSHALLPTFSHRDTSFNN